mgnify:CR=1 FL=1
MVMHVLSATRIIIVLCLSIESILFTGCASLAGAESVRCSNYLDNVVERATSLPIGANRYLGEQERVLKHEEIFDAEWLSASGASTCNQIIRHRSACMGDIYTAKLYRPGIIIEEGQSNDYYWLHGNFPATPNGLKPSLTKDEVIGLLGKPLFEADRMLKYMIAPTNRAQRDSYLNIYFENGELSIMSFVMWKGTCVE